MQDRVIYIQHMQMESNVLKLLAHITVRTHLALIMFLQSKNAFKQSQHACCDSLNTETNTIQPENRNSAYELPVEEPKPQRNQRMNRKNL